MKEFIKSLQDSPMTIFKLFDSVQDLLFLMERVGCSIRYVYVNKNVRDLLDVSDSIIGKTLEDVVSHSEVETDLISHYHEAFNKKEAVRYEQQLVSKDGDIFIGESSINPIIEENGNCHYALCIVRDITQLRREQKILERMAFEDHLTGIANRRSFDDEVAEVIIQARTTKSAAKFAVMMLDGKEFKNINDTLGHDAGDAVIKEFARRVQSSVRENDTVARLGGDELAILLPNLYKTEEAIRVAENIIQSLEEPFYYKGTEIRFGAGIGISFYPDHGSTKRQMLRYADEALYDAKEMESMSNYRIYNCGHPQQEKNPYVI